MLNYGDTSCLFVNVQSTNLTSQWRNIIKQLVESEQKFSVVHFHGSRCVRITLRTVKFLADGTVDVTFSKLGSLHNEYEPAIVKERIRQMFDVRHY